MTISQRNLQIRNSAFVVALMLAAVALFLLSARFPVQGDFTQNGGNSLGSSSLQVLDLMPGAIHVRVFSPERDAQQGDMRKAIRRFVALYQRHKHDVTLEFIDPALDPEAVRKNEIRANGEMVIEYQGRLEHLSRLNEQTFSGALLNLAHRKDQSVMYVIGHGERKLDGIANDDLGEFGRRLSQLGYRISSLNLAIAQDVPGNARLLVITQPQTDWLPGEVDKLIRYVDGGGNLLWLMDAEPMHGLEPLAEQLGLSLSPGVVLDPDAEKMRAPATWVLGTDYPPHAITQDFSMITAFPFARALGHEDGSDWHYSTLVDGAPHGWVSEHIPKAGKKPRFNRNTDIPGPVEIALALERDSDDNHTQRIVVVGSGAFLSNTYVGNGGNLNLGVKMVDWLGNEDNLVTVPPPAIQDDQITLSTLQLGILTWGLAIVLPLLLALTGGLIWWRRRI